MDAITTACSTARTVRVCLCNAWGICITIITISLGVQTDGIPTQTASSYTVNHLDKTVDVPELAKKYSGAGKIEIYNGTVSTSKVVIR